MFAGNEQLSVLRLTKIIQGLVDQREKPAELSFLKRARIVPAVDGEVMGRFIGRVLIADMVADDAVAGVYTAGKMTLDTYQSPNLKIGRHFSQSQLKQLQQIMAQMRGTRGEQIFVDFMSPTVENALLGVQQRMESLLIAMHINAINYDKLGMKIANANWRFPSDLQITVAIPWTDNVNATPVADTLAAKLVGSIRYGVQYTRMRMSTPAFRYAVATTEYQNKARTFIPPQLTFNNLSANDLDTHKRLWEAVTGMSVELYDSRYWSQDQAGAHVSSPFLPINKVILDNPSNDNNPGTYDFSNGTVTESLFFGMNPASVVGASSAVSLEGQVGPLAYATFPPELNPANLTLWACAVGWPRRHVDQMSSVMTVGTFGDQIAIGEPF